MVSKVLQTLYADHVNLSQLLDLIDDEIAHIGADSSGLDFETLALALEYCVDYPKHFHHPTEDLVYGVLIQRMPELAKKIIIITTDHRILSQLTRSFSEAVASAIEDGETASVHRLGLEFLRHYRHHMNVEETEFFPAAEAHLTQDDWSEIETLAKIPIDPLFTDHVREAYQALKRRIVARAVQKSTD